MAKVTNGTPHINAQKGDFGKTVLMPGDPLRSKFVAENFLEDVVLVNNIRGVQGYSGNYQGVKVSVMASGMGIPSIGIYSYELYNYFDVSNIIRIGTIGALDKDIKVKDLIIAMGACTNSAFVDQFNLPGHFAPIASYELLQKSICAAQNAGVNYNIGNVLSSDNFYNDDSSANDKWIKMGVLGIEMEAAGLYTTALRARKNALAICTVSDNIITGEEISAEERQNCVSDMIKIALDTAVLMEK